jgi:hypothetical protein
VSAVAPKAEAETPTAGVYTTLDDLVKLQYRARVASDRSRASV